MPRQPGKPRKLPKRARRKISKETRQRAKELRWDGWSLSAIASKLGISVGSVHRFCKGIKAPRHPRRLGVQRIASNMDFGDEDPPTPEVDPPAPEAPARPKPEENTDKRARADAERLLTRGWSVEDVAAVVNRRVGWVRRVFQELGG